MKIALIYDAAYPWMKGGGEKALWEIAVRLTKKGHEIHLFTTQLWEGAGNFKKEGVWLHGVRARQPFYRSNGKRSFLQPLEFALGLFGRLWQTRDEKFDVIYCTVFPYYSVFSVGFFRWVSGQKIPWTLAWLEIWGIKYWQSYVGWFSGLLGGLIEWLCARCCNNHLVISEMQRRRLIHLLGVNEVSTQLIPRGVQEIKQTPLYPKRTHRLLYAGRLVDYKNLTTVIEALPLVKKTIPDVQLAIIGSGPEEARLRSLSSQLGMQETVDWVPPLASSEDVLGEIGRAEIFLQPSTREGLGVVALEAMSMGTLVIASAHPESAMTDIIRHDSNGLLVEKWNDPTAWASMIVQAIENPQRRQTLQLSARQDAKKFLWNNGPLDNLEVYLQKLASSVDK